MVRGKLSMKNPLIKRIPKELRSDWPKYIVIIIFMVLMIGLVSGMYVGHESMMGAIEEGRSSLKLEDGSFELNSEASKELIEGIESGETADVRQYYIDKGVKEASLLKGVSEELYEKVYEQVVKAVDEKWDETAKEYGLDDENFKPVKVTVYENFYRNENEDHDSDGNTDATVRIFKSDSKIDMASFLDGRAPEAKDEIAIDRMHASNVGVKVGDTITVGDRKLKVVGLLSYVNYLTMHESNTDLMFDSFGFNVGMVTPEGFDAFSSRIHYSYAYLYDDKPESKTEKADLANDFLKCLITQSLVNDNEVEDFLPEYLRQASNFAPSDIDGDTTGTSILCYILIAVIAFIFAITISNTIEKEATVIGTLRASGYTRGELLFHYMSMPFVVTLIGAAIGNIIGYTLFEDVAVNLYYESYSLPACTTVWSPLALVKTTVIPLVLMFFINLFVISKRLKLSPLKFLRRDLNKSKRSKARRIPAWSFLARFRVRIVFQNLPDYIVMIFGVIFIEVMLCFAFGFPDALKNYSDSAPSMMLAEYQYMLMGNKDDAGNVINTSEKTAEKASITSLLYPKEKRSGLFEGFGSGGDEAVTVYGIVPDSKYVKIDDGLKGNNVYISSAFAEKFGLGDGDTITLHEEYQNKSYEFKVCGITDYYGGVAVFMPAKEFNSFFEKDEDYFSGYISHNEITDIDEKYIATVITVEDITKVSRQLDHSMGDMFVIFKYVLVVLAAALIYLLTKIIIEKNENAISMVKVLGFKNSEIAALYIVPTAIIVTVISILGFAASFALINWIFKVFMFSMDGWFEFYMKPSSMILTVVYLLVGYAFVSVIDYRRIRKIPLNEALKNVE